MSSTTILDQLNPKHETCPRCGAALTAGNVFSGNVWFLRCTKCDWINVPAEDETTYYAAKKSISEARL